MEYYLRWVDSTADRIEQVLLFPPNYIGNTNICVEVIAILMTQ